MATEDVTVLLQKTGCYCLNESSPQQFTHLFVGDHTLALKSDADEQLLLHLAFGQTVSLKQIQFGVPANGSCPNTVKLFVNQNNLDFAQASDALPTQTITLAPPAASNGDVITVQLNVARWTRTESVTIFVEDNHGSDVSSLFSLRLFGTPMHGTDVSKIHDVNKHEH